MKDMKRPATKKPDMTPAYRTQGGAKPAIKKTTVELPESLHKRLMRLKLDRDMSMGALIIDALERTYPEEP
ncbi:hypothetical protein [Kocuria rosea]|uniref:hypothetical protein n=1 Tax=Kocuria rosea TaxID=1275 RepID=UPI002B256535|nr:hypothetical protein [Kocuria rosea]MEB2529125.1 hypothetical protein [Kocuria rosea]MEB2619436.1 hypothetical protein [Kocuria rosea]